MKKLRKENGICLMEEITAAAGYEPGMIRKLRSPHVLVPGEQYTESGDFFCYEVGEGISFTEYADTAALGFTDITGILIQLKSVLELLKNHMLTEDNCVCDPDYVFVYPLDGVLRFPAVPAVKDGYRDGIGKLIRAILLSVDREDSAALKLAVNLFRSAEEGDLRISTFLSASEACRRQEKRNGAGTEETETAKAAERETVSGTAVPDSPEEDLFYEEIPLEESPQERKAGKKRSRFGKKKIPELVQKLSLAAFVPGGLMILVFLLRGKAAVIRMLPAFGVLFFSIFSFVLLH